jgi:hypothetical protein
MVILKVNDVATLKVPPPPPQDAKNKSEFRPVNHDRADSVSHKTDRAIKEESNIQDMVETATPSNGWACGLACVEVSTT